MQDSVLMSLMRINRQRMRTLRKDLVPYQYVGTMHLIVLYTGKHPGASQDDIAAFYGLDKTSVARDARRLEDMGHICRTVNPDNRRQYQLELTEGGKTMISVLHGIYGSFEEKLSTGFDEETWQQLQALLKQLEHNSIQD